MGETNSSLQIAVAARRGAAPTAGQHPTQCHCLTFTMAVFGDWLDEDCRCYGSLMKVGDVVVNLEHERKKRNKLGMFPLDNFDSTDQLTDRTQTHSDSLRKSRRDNGRA